MKYDVFISYSRKDYANEDKTVIPGNIVSQIKDFLQANGYSYWFDEDGIYSSDTFPTVIAEALHDSEIFLFISTENSNASKWTARELAVAAHLGKKTIPFRVDNSEYATSTLMFLASLDYIEYFKNPQKAFDSLLRTLNKHFSKRKEAKEAERRKKEQEQKAKELAEALKQAEKLRLERIGKIDTEIEKLQVEIDQCDAESSTIQLNIVGLNEQLAQYKEELNSIANTRNGISASIAKLEQEKMSLLTPASETKEEKPKSASKKIEKETEKSEKSETDEGSSKIMTSWKYLKSLRKRYWFHLLLTIATFFFVCKILLRPFLFEYYYALCTLWGSISIYGVVQLLKGKKDGFVTLLLNSITFYLVWYLGNELSLIAYKGLTIYLFFVATLFIIHKSDKDSPLSWNKMIKSKFKQPKKVLTYVAEISVISSFAVPYIYAQKCGMRSYDIEDADRLLIYSIHGILKRGWYAEKMGYEYMPDEKDKYNWYNLEPDVEKALWWYELAQSDGEDVAEEITYCKECIEATEKGFVNCEVYGRCGINKENGCIMRISVTGFYDYKNARFSSYDGSKWQSNGSYLILLENGDLTQGEFEVEGAKVEKIDKERQKVYDIYGDSVKMRYIQEGVVISERIMPVTKVTTKLILRDENNRKYSGSLKYDEKYTIEVEYPVEGAELQIGDYSMDYRMKYNIIDYDEYLNVKEKFANSIKFQIHNERLMGRRLLVIYKRDDKVIAHDYLPVEGDWNELY